jgi:hypothetical protein
MATIIKLKGSATPNLAPSVNDLSYKEVALNYADGRLYYKNAAGQIAYFSAGATAGGQEGQDDDLFNQLAFAIKFGAFPLADYGNITDPTSDAFGQVVLFTYDNMATEGLRIIDNEGLV